MSEEITKEEFEALPPWKRGYCVYTQGRDDSQPNVPDEDNPYTRNFTYWLGWNQGNSQANTDHGMRG